MPILVTRAPAKINLTLHVLGRRAGDGYHELESLVAFTGAGDTLSLTPGNDGAPDDLALTVSGPTAGPAGPLDDNLVIRAARHLAVRRPGLRLGAFHLVKRLPVAAGIGGGSSDAAAALRLLGRSNGLDPADPLLLEAARATGADVPVCLDPRARMMRGAGETLGPILGIAPLPAVLINPGVPVETAPVFRALGLAAGQRHRPEPHPEIPGSADGAAVLSLISPARNDLEAPARGLAPAIDVALQALAERAGCRLARMSGSGATVFGLFADRRTAVRAARHIRARHPGWWVKPTFLR